jgi:NADH-quinone oxidoreductase subunit L
MIDLLWTVPFFPLLGFFILFTVGGYLSDKQSTVIGISTVVLSAVMTLTVGCHFLEALHAPGAHAFVITLWNWIDLPTMHVGLSFQLDSLSMLMIFVITFVGSLIAIFASEFMEEYGDYRRFYAAMNLFIANMLVLVLADNLLLLFLGWEGVGLCSYLLIGFWYQDPKNGRAARKAFLMTKVGDTLMAIGLFLIFSELKTLNIQEILLKAPQVWPVGSVMATAVGLLLLGGACGKSAQFPLQAWLPDAMVGPTPVSALIHAATMVTAGVYLIARTNALFALAPTAQLAVAIVGAITLLIAGFSAMVQKDLKRVLAYSTISQIGYMFLALGVGAYSAAMFHFMTHAFFKALLFLCAGVIGHCLHHEHNMFKMGGLKNQLPITFWTFFIGSCSLAALPLFTAGFYSKDLILWEAFASDKGAVALWLAGFIGAFVTSFYTFRMVFITFFGKAKSYVNKTPGLRMHIPLIILGILSAVGGLVETPHLLGHVTLFSQYMHSVLPEVTMDPVRGTEHYELILQGLALLVTAIGIFLAYKFCWPGAAEVITPSSAKAHGHGDHGHSHGAGHDGHGHGHSHGDDHEDDVSGIRKFWMGGWGFDWFYNEVFTKNYVRIAQINKNDAVDLIYKGISQVTIAVHKGVQLTQTGKVAHYATGIVLGTIILVGMVVLL